MRKILFLTIGRGHTRVILFTKKRVYKIPRVHLHCDSLSHRLRLFFLGWISNIQEYEWTNISSLPFLCPVIGSWFFSFIITMPRCSQDDVNEGEVLDFLKDMDPVNSSIFGHDLRKENYGHLDGRLVKLDYGVTYNSPRLKSHEEPECRYQNAV